MPFYKHYPYPTITVNSDKEKFEAENALSPLEEQFKDELSKGLFFMTYINHMDITKSKPIKSWEEFMQYVRGEK